ncbi:MAG: glycosyltransferase family 2 protein [Anaerolineaceae bacterium]|nr:glycosyltransferase family 2 protein [Anaerolineaceae bacterium]
MPGSKKALQMQRVDSVVPVYNEQEALTAFHTQLRQAIDPLPYRFTIIYVDDGSSDDTAAGLRSLAAADERVQVIELSRNFGHQAALTAGIDQTAGDFVITMDGDGQHPPSLIAEMLTLAQSGYEVVLTQRVESQRVSVFKRLTSALFYRLINRIGSTDILAGSADFRLLARPAADALRSMPEYHRFLRGMVAWMGFKSVILPFTPPERLAGRSKYSLPKMLRLASDAVFSFSLVPLYIGISLGGLMLLLALAEAVYVLSFWITGNAAQLAPGWSSLMFVLLIIGGFLMTMLGFIGIYIGYIFQEVKRRPVYLVRRRLGGEITEQPDQQAGEAG